MDCACSAQLETAPEFRARQAQRVAQNPQQRHLRRDVHALSFPVKGKLNGWHWNPPQESPKYTTGKGRNHKKHKRHNNMCVLCLLRFLSPLLYSRRYETQNERGIIVALLAVT